MLLSLLKRPVSLARDAYQKKGTTTFAGVPLRLQIRRRPYGRLLAFEFIFVFDLVFEFMFEFMFEFDTVAIGVAIGVGLVMFTFVRLALLDALFEPVSPHAAPRAPIAKTAVSAIFFIILL
jgi:hypothetical protein